MPSITHGSLYGASMGVARETAVAEASGPAATKDAAYWWAILIGLLVAARLVWEWAE